MRREPVKATVFACLVAMFFLAAPLAAGAVVREGRIEGRPGFSFRTLVYKWDHLFVDIVNGTRNNATFGGTMLFLDRYGRTVARAELLPGKIKRKSTKRWRGQFTEGSGEEASKAVRLMWVFDMRDE